MNFIPITHYCLFMFAVRKILDEKFQNFSWLQTKGLTYEILPTCCLLILPTLFKLYATMRIIEQHNFVFEKMSYVKKYSALPFHCLLDCLILCIIQNMFGQNAKILIVVCFNTIRHFAYLLPTYCLLLLPLVCEFHGFMSHVL